MIGTKSIIGARCAQMESLYEYGSRAGFWRLRRLFDEAKMPVTVFGVAKALARNPDAVAAMKESGWEIASHGLRWIDYQDFPEDVERAHILEAIALHTEVTGERPLGWYQGARARTRRVWSRRKAGLFTTRIPMRMICRIMIGPMAGRS